MGNNLLQIVFETVFGSFTCLRQTDTICYKYCLKLYLVTRALDKLIQSATYIV